jgi:rSAM/selenodomain-associated transferase 1
MPKDSCLIIFSKTPELGKVKTRLRSQLTEQESLSLHVALLKDALYKCSLIDADVHLYLTKAPTLPFAAGVPIFEQRGVDLGERMFHAFEDALQFHKRCVIIGTDSPLLSPDRIQESLNQLVNCDAVLGPTEDGGYYLIGMNQPLIEPFVNIPWSTGAVLGKSVDALKDYKVLLLEPCFDVDEPADLIRLETELEALTESYVMNTKSWLQHLKEKRNRPSS